MIFSILNTLIVFFVPITFTIFLVWLFWPKGRRKLPRGDEGVVVSYEPPADMTPAEFGMIYDYKGGRLEVIAALYGLRLRKVLSLDRDETGKVHMQLLSYDPSQLAIHENLLLKYFFNKSRTVVLQTEAARPDFALLQSYFYYAVMQDLQKNGYAFFEQGLETQSYVSYLESLQRNPLKAVAVISNQGAIGKKLTDKAKTLMPQIDGFALYIRTAEIDKIEFHIHGDIKRFIEKMTPYAIVLDEMDRWGIVDIPFVTTITDPEYLTWQGDLASEGKSPMLEEVKIIDSYQVVPSAS